MKDQSFNLRLRTFFIFCTVSIYLQQSLQAQVAPTQQFEVVFQSDGHSLLFTADSLQRWQQQAINLPDLVITNHLGEPRDTLQQAKGVMLSEILKHIPLREAASPKHWSAFYYVLQAADGYTVVYSWNELFNSPAGQQVWLITEANGLNFKQLPESVLVVNYADFRTGRRYVKALKTITIAKAE